MKTKRHMKIMQLIEQKNINSQEELLLELKKSGFNVTQATVSRDIKELRLNKILDKNGKYIYSSNSVNERDNKRFINQVLLKDIIISIKSSNNIIVVNCKEGMAQGVCKILELNFKNMVGTLADYDTIFILMKNKEEAIKAMNDINKIISEN